MNLKLNFFFLLVLGKLQVFQDKVVHRYFLKYMYRLIEVFSVDSI